MIIELKWKDHTIVKIEVWTLVLYALGHCNDLFNYFELEYGGNIKNLQLLVDGKVIDPPAIWKDIETRI